MQRKDRWPSLLSLATLIAGLTTPAARAKAQDQPAATTTAPRVFFDCSRGPECDNTYYRTEITWVITGKRHFDMFERHGAHGDIPNADGRTASAIMLRKRDPYFHKIAKRLAVEC